MRNGKGFRGGWGLALVVATGLGMGCTPREEIGEAPSSDGGATGLGDRTDGTSSNGCFDPLTAAALPEIGPNNQVFLPGRHNTNTLINYADQVVFEPPNWELIANFPPSGRSEDASIRLPEELGQVPRSIGEVYITRPQCQGLPAAGRTVRVHAWWKLDGAIVRTPTEGIALGTIDGESFIDSARVSLVGGSQDTRPLNTLSPIVLEHTFPTSDTTDAGNLILRLWLLETFVFPSTLYINRIERQ